jgi:hypothetical protein
MWPKATAGNIYTAAHKQVEDGSDKLKSPSQRVLPSFRIGLTRPISGDGIAGGRGGGDDRTMKEGCRCADTEDEKSML